MPFVRIPYLFAQLTPMLDAPFIKSAESIYLRSTMQDDGSKKR
jgi:hypothetical protein